MTHVTTYATAVATGWHRIGTTVHIVADYFDTVCGVRYTSSVRFVVPDGSTVCTTCAKTREENR